MRRVLLHLGFHKTGTTSAQDFLTRNRKLIWPHYALSGIKATRTSGVTDAAFRYERMPIPELLDDFDNKFSSFLQQRDFGKKRGLILSDENISGRRPGQTSNVWLYSSAPDITQTMIDRLHRHFVEPIEITVYYSTRPRDSWMRSLWGHELRRGLLKQDLAEFTKTLRSVPSPDDIAAVLKERLQNCRVISASLPNLQQQDLGSGAPFSEFLRSGPGNFDDLAPPKRKGRGPDGTTRERLLELNCADLDADTRKRLKAKALEDSY